MEKRNKVNQWQSKVRESVKYTLPPRYSQPSVPFSAFVVLFGSLLLSLGSQSYFRVSLHSAILH